MTTPIIWLLLGRKMGDNTQVLAVADATGYSYESKNIIARPWELLPHLLLGTTLAGIDLARSSPLQAPWPDLVISAGRRNEPVARWIRQQSGGRCKLVHIGRPWAALANYDLIITTPQYFLPRQDNVLHNTLPLHRLHSTSLAEPSATLRQQLQTLVRPLVQPYTALLVGGDSGRFVFTAEKGRRLGRAVNSLVAESGGSLLLSDSPRTPAGSFDALLGEIDVPFYCYRWRDGSDDNPYLAYLALADQLVVTGESMSMLAEASAMSKPLHIFDMGDGERPWWSCWYNYRYKPLSHRCAMRFGPTRMRRDVGMIQQALVGSGRASWLGQPANTAAVPDSNTDSGRGVDPGVELVVSAARVLQLLAQDQADL